MEDFNADNAKVEQALAAEAEARQVAIAELTQKAGAQLLYSVTLSSATSTLDVSLADVDWSQWNTVRILMSPVQGSGGTYEVYANRGSYSVDLGIAANRSGTFLLIFYPTFTPGARIMGHYWPPYSNSQIINNSQTIGSLTEVGFIAASSNFQAGTEIKVWGSR